MNIEFIVMSSFPISESCVFYHFSFLSSKMFINLIVISKELAFGYVSCTYCFFLLSISLISILIFILSFLLLPLGLLFLSSSSFIKVEAR